MIKHRQFLRSGFTLLSTIIVLFIIGLLLTITIVQGEQKRKNLTINTTLQMLAQQYERVYYQAVAEGVNYYVVFNKDRVRYYRRGISREDSFEELLLPNELTTDRSHKVQIHASSGHVDPKTVTFYADNNRYYLTFQLGGQYVVTVD